MSTTPAERAMQIGANAPRLDELIETNRRRAEMDRAAARTIGSVGKVKGLQLRCVDASAQRVVLERVDPEADAAELELPAEDELPEGTTLEQVTRHELAADMARRFPAGRPARVGGHYFMPVSTSALRVTLRPHGRNKDGTRAPRRARR